MSREEVLIISHNGVARKDNYDGRLCYFSEDDEGIKHQLPVVDVALKDGDDIFAYHVACIRELSPHEVEQHIQQSGIKHFATP